jgi:hypothetical protein
MGPTMMTGKIMPALVVVGSLNMDFVVSVGRLPVPGETVLGRDFRMIPGGKGANQACAAGRLSAGGGGRASDRTRRVRRLRRSPEGQPGGGGRGRQSCLTPLSRSPPAWP